MAILGMRERVLSSKAIWVCTTCFLCSEKCPQKVDPTQAFFAMKNIAAKEIGMPEGIKLFAESIYDTGRSAEVGDLVFFRENRRSPPSHVGIYMGQDTFIHVSSLQGVILSSLENDYYRIRFYEIRRINE